MKIKSNQKNEYSAMPLPLEWSSLAQAFLHQSRLQPHALAVCDSLGTKLTYSQLLLKSIVLANHLTRKIDQSPCVGIMLPPSAAAVIANLAVAFLGKVSVNLNYKSGQNSLNDYLDDCQIKHVITARPMLAKVNLEVKCSSIYIESIKEEAGLFTKIESWTEAELLPEHLFGNVFAGFSLQHRISPEIFGLNATAQENLQDAQKINDPAAIIFTAGSTSKPKGVVLSHTNILSNINAIKEQGQIKSGEIVLGVIPFFHSFGLTMTLWAPLCLGETVVFHYDPFDARRIGALCETFKATCLICTPTMMASYLKRGKPEQFHTLRNCILGGEKMRLQQLKMIQNEIGITPVEGYGLAETSPVVACNVPNHVTLEDGRTIEGTRLGTVGLPVPGTAIRIVDLDSGKILPSGQAGLINVKGPQVMLGYLNNVAQTKKCVKDGWFNTGDIGFLDDDGFLTVTGRVSQFSKIAGEMVSHLVIEEELLKVTGLPAGTLSVTSVADDGRGERIKVLHTALLTNPQKVIDDLRKTDIPRILIPSASDFICIDELPVLPNGKLNLRKLNEIAQSAPLTSLNLSV